jgi:hypothetical protein
MKKANKKTMVQKKKKLVTPPNKKVNMGGGPFVGRHTTG